MSIGAKCRPHEPQAIIDASDYTYTRFRDLRGWTCAKCGAELRATWMRKDEKRKRGRA